MREQYEWLAPHPFSVLPREEQVVPQPAASILTSSAAPMDLVGDVASPPPQSLAQQLPPAASASAELSSPAPAPLPPAPASLPSPQTHLTPPSGEVFDLIDTLYPALDGIWSGLLSADWIHAEQQSLQEWNQPKKVLRIIEAKWKEIVTTYRTKATGQ